MTNSDLAEKATVIINEFIHKFCVQANNHHVDATMAKTKSAINHLFFDILELAIEASAKHAPHAPSPKPDAINVSTEIHADARTYNDGFYRYTFPNVRKLTHREYSFINELIQTVERLLTYGDNTHIRTLCGLWKEQCKLHGRHV